MLKGSTLAANSYLIKQLPKATAFVNNKMHIIFASDQWITDFSHTNHEILGTSIDTLFNAKNKHWLPIFSSCITDNTQHQLTEFYIDSNGNEKWYEVHTVPWYDERENVIGAIIQTKEARAQNDTENKLEKLQIALGHMSDVAKIGFWDYHIVNDVLFWGDKAKKIHEVPTNYEPNMIEATNFYTNGHSRNTFSMMINKAIITETPFSEKLEIITAKGTKKWVLTSGKPTYENAKLTGLIGTIQDISEINSAETKHRENEHLLRTLIDNLPLNVYIKDLESRKVLVNKAEALYCGVNSIDEILGKDDFEIFDKKTATASRKDDLTVMRDLKPILSREMFHQKKDGSTTTFLTSKIPLIDTDGHAYGLVGISLDISDLKQKEDDLRKLINVTSSQNEKLINFAHIVSHNLRSHTSNFSMLLNFLSQEDNEVERKKIMEMLVDSSDNLLETISNLNEVVDINENKNLERKAIGLNERIKAIEKSLSADLITHKTKLINKVPVKLKIKVIPAYIDSILTNFITNAIKYQSPKRASKVILSATVEKNQTVLSISDNGLGIDLDKHGDKLFGMYKTFHNRIDSKGIGLYITKNQVEAMNGKITVSSKVGSGSTFKIYFND